MMPCRIIAMGKGVSDYSYLIYCQLEQYYGYIYFFKTPHLEYIQFWMMKIKRKWKEEQDIG